MCYLEFFDDRKLLIYPAVIFVMVILLGLMLYFLNGYYHYGIYNVMREEWVALLSPPMQECKVYWAS